MPVVAGASLLSSLLGSDAYANTRSGQSVDNSQTISLLGAEVSSNSPRNSKDKAVQEVSGSLSGSIVADSALLPSVSPSSISSIGGVDVDSSGLNPDDISVYVVHKGDTIAQIAEMFDVSSNTILWANDLKKGEKLKEGDTLFILPVSGVQHTVAKGETLANIAKKYKVDMETITSFNGLEKGAVLAIGDELVIPDAEMPNDSSPSAAPKKKSSGGGSYLTNAPLKDATGYFIHPVPEMKRRSQGLHGPGNRGVDMAAPTGTRILAAAEGTVLLARTGYNGGYGNMVIIQHPNGTKTLYGHMSRIDTTTGAHVKQGGQIGAVGSTGRSTGPHLHFEVQGAKNPF
jgi:LysM repeat protein